MSAGQNLPNEARLLQTLQELLKLPALELGDALMAAAQRIAEALDCDKVDAFLFDESKQTLRAVGTSDTPMGHKQHALGLDMLPVANGGRIVEAFTTVRAVDGHVDRDPEEMRGIVTGLVRVRADRAFRPRGARRGVLTCISARAILSAERPDVFQAVAHGWGSLRARGALEQARHAASNESARWRRRDHHRAAHDLRNH